MTAVPRWLTLDSSTERLSIALGPGPHAGALVHHEGEGGARASSTLIPVIQDLLARVGWSMADLDAIAFGCGPGSFTGLRTACAVVQGLAVAARPSGIPVVPVNTLWAVAEDARFQAVQAGEPEPQRILAVLDARMDEYYWAECATDAGGLTLLGDTRLGSPQGLQLHSGWPGDATASTPAGLLLAGNVVPQQRDRWPHPWQGVPQRNAWPTATALLRLMPALCARGHGVSAAQAQPLYVRDKVAQTTLEREQAAALKDRA